jgi:hypothetical protein
MSAISLPDTGDKLIAEIIDDEYAENESPETF